MIENLLNPMVWFFSLPIGLVFGWAVNDILKNADILLEKSK